MMDNVLIITWACVFLVAFISVLFFVDKRGMRLEFFFEKWLPHLNVSSVNTPGMSKKEVKKLVQKEVMSAIDSHVSAMDTYKDSCQLYDANMKALIAHKLDDITIPELPNEDFTRSQLLALTVKLELLILNVENHYTQAASSVEQLTLYVQDRYARLLRIFSKFTEDVEFARFGAYEVLVNWWEIVRPAVTGMINAKISLNVSASKIFSDSIWQTRMKTSLATRKNVLDVLGKVVDVREPVADYFDRVLLLNIPEYLVDDKV